MVSGPDPHNILQSVRGGGVLKLFMLVMNSIPVHEYTNNEGWERDAIETLGTQLEVGYLFDGMVKIFQT